MKFFVQMECHTVNALFRKAAFEEGTQSTFLPIENPNRFESLLHDLREVFCFLENSVPRWQLIPSDTREEILGAHEGLNSIEEFISGIMSRSTRKLEALHGWDDALQTTHSNLLRGLLTYAQIYSNCWYATEIGKRVCDEIKAFCKARSIEGFEIPSRKLDPALVVIERELGFRLTAPDLAAGN
jgi:hypothetical protein